MDFVHTPLFKLFIGVLIALCVHLYKKQNGTPTYADLKSEFKVVIVPAIALTAGLIFAGESYVDAATGGLIALGTALGINSKKAD